LCVTGVALALEFNKLVEQLQKMGRMIQEIDFDVNDRLDIARRRFEAATDLDFIHERINMVRRPDVSGYRGAAPLDAPFHERICDIFPPPPLPPSATIVAADGSQIYPNEQWRMPYFLTNVGMYVYFHGEERTPIQTTTPKLVYHPERVRDKSKRVLSSRTIDALRTTREIQELGSTAWEVRGEARPLVALYDNHLMFFVNTDVTGHVELMKRYHAGLVNLHDAGALLAGYVDNPTRSRLVIRLLHLLSLSDDEVKSTDLGTGDLEGLKDLDLFKLVLAPGERSALMLQNSPRNLKYKQRGENYEIAFFYVKVTSGYQDAIARIDIPMWVARDPQKVNDLHALILEQCAMQGRNPYPYALTRADELAVVSSKDKAKLEEMIRLEWRLNKPEIDPLVISAKNFGKQIARSQKRSHEL
jgi:NurA domain